MTRTPSHSVFDKQPPDVQERIRLAIDQATAPDGWAAVSTYLAEMQDDEVYGGDAAEQAHDLVAWGHILPHEIDARLCTCGRAWHSDNHEPECPPRPE